MPLSGKDCRKIRGVLEGKATNFRYSDVARWLERAGFEHVGGKGSHRYWVHPATGTRATLVERGKEELLPAYVKDAASAILKIGSCHETPPRPVDLGRP